MVSFILMSGIGALLTVLGIMNMTGNISSIHWYHRQRVTEENKKPFGRLVGLGTLIIGIAIIIFGILMLVSEKTQTGIYAVIGSAELIAACVIGIAMSVYAMIKYNKGVF